jgi:hypothetical protein
LEASMPCAFDFSTNFDHQLIPQGQMADFNEYKVSFYYLLVKLYYQLYCQLFYRQEKPPGLVGELQMQLAVCP